MTEYHRIPHAATTLVEEVQAQRKSAKYEAVGDPDGFGTVRTIAFDKATTKALSDALEAALVEDPRVQELHTLEGRLHVTFVGDQSSERRDPFSVGEADSVLQG